MAHGRIIIRYHDFHVLLGNSAENSPFILTSFLRMSPPGKLRRVVMRSHHASAGISMPTRIHPTFGSGRSYLE